MAHLEDSYKTVKLVRFKSYVFYADQIKLKLIVLQK